MILFSACKITQSPMQPIYKDEAEASSFKKRILPQISPWQHPMQVILSNSGKYPLSYNWWRADKNLRVYLPEGYDPIQNNMFPCTARNKSEHAGLKWCDVFCYNTTHIWKSGSHPLSHALFPFQKKVQAFWKYSLSWRKTTRRSWFWKTDTPSIRPANTRAYRYWCWNLHHIPFCWKELV